MATGTTNPALAAEAAAAAGDGGRTVEESPRNGELEAAAVGDSGDGLGEKDAALASRDAKGGSLAAAAAAGGEAEEKLGEKEAAGGGEKEKLGGKEDALASGDGKDGRLEASEAAGGGERDESGDKEVVLPSRDEKGEGLEATVTKNAEESAEAALEGGAGEELGEKGAALASQDGKGESLQAPGGEAEEESSKKEAALESPDEKDASLVASEAKNTEESAPGGEAVEELSKKELVPAAADEKVASVEAPGTAAATAAGANPKAMEDQTDQGKAAPHEPVSVPRDENLVADESRESNFAANGGDATALSGNNGEKSIGDEGVDNSGSLSQDVGKGHLEEPNSANESKMFDEITEKGQEAQGDTTRSKAGQDVVAEMPKEAEKDGVDGGEEVSAHEVVPLPAPSEEAKEEKGGGRDACEESSEKPPVSSVVEHEQKADGNGAVLAANDDGEGDGGGNEVDEEDEGMDSDTPARVAILESPEAAKELMKGLEGGSSSGSAVSGLGSSRDYRNSMDGQIVPDSDEDEDEDDEEEEKEVFDSAALAAFLRAATEGSPDGNITVTSQDGNRIFSIDRPAGLGSSVPSLRPTAPRPAARSNLFSSSELAVTADPTEDMTEEEKQLHEKVELIRVRFLRLVYRLGHSPEETVAAQVLYRLSLAEGIRRGRQTNRAFSLENARKKALQIEAEGKEDLNFSCNILVLGKTGVGKSATVNSIFGEEKSKTDPFEPATASVREIVGTVGGVQIRVIDTPGLRTSVMDQSSNRRILSAVKKYTKKCPPDIVLYVDRLDSQTRDLNDLPLLRTITSTLGSSIWFNAIVALTHAASAPPDGPNGSAMTYEVFVAQRSHIVQQSIRQAAGDMRLMNPVALVENHPSCRRNREGQKVLPNGQSWRHQMLLLCYSSKILSEANSLLKLQDPSPGKLFGFRFRSPPLPFLLSSLLQSRPHPKLSADQGGDNGDSDVDLDDFSDAEQEEEEDEYDQLPPFKPLKKSQLAKLTKEQKRAYFDEYDYRVKLLQKKQWKEELRRLKEMKKKGKTEQDTFAGGDMAEDYDQDGAPASVPVPLPDMVLPPSFDGDTPTYRYRFLEPTSNLLARPVLDTHGWDHDCGYDGVSLEESLALVAKFPAVVSVQVTKDKKEFSIHLDSSIAAKHGENGSSLAGFDIQTVGRQLAYVLRGETKFKNFKKNKTTGGLSVTFLGDIVATGVKVEDQLSVGKRLQLVASTGTMRAQGDTAYGANLEARLRDKDFPIGQALSTLGLSLMKWRGDLALGANLQSQFPVARNSKMAVRVGLNNKLSGQITVKTSTSEQIQIALLGLVPVLVNIYKSFRPAESYASY